MKRVIILSLLTLAIGFSACRKETITVYEVNPVHVGKRGDKSTLKSDLQFVSIAYSDLFRKQIGAQELNVLIAGYKSVGDKPLIIDLIIRNLLNYPGIIKPSGVEMRQDPSKFLSESFARFLIRKPSEMELWFFEDIIVKNSNLLPEDIYYALLSCEEYRYY